MKKLFLLMLCLLASGYIFSMDDADDLLPPIIDATRVDRHEHEKPRESLDRACLRAGPHGFWWTVAKRRSGWPEMSRSPLAGELFFKTRVEEKDDSVPTILDIRVRSIKRSEHAKSIYYAAILDGACVSATYVTNGPAAGEIIVRRDGMNVLPKMVYYEIKKVYDAHFAPKEAGELEENA